MIIDELINIFPYKFSKKEKNEYFLKGIKELTKFHKKKCKEYNKILNFINPSKFNKSNLSDYPFLPTKILKNLILRVLQKIK